MGWDGMSGGCVCVCGGGGGGNEGLLVGDRSDRIRSVKWDGEKVMGEGRVR